MAQNHFYLVPVSCDFRLEPFMVELGKSPLNCWNVIFLSTLIKVNVKENKWNKCEEKKESSRPLNHFPLEKYTKTLK